MSVQPTDLPAYGRFDKTIPIPRVPADATLPVVLRAAARIISRNGLHQGDYCPDVFDRSTTMAHCDRPLSIVAAVRCVTTGSPHRTDDLSDRAVAELAGRLLVDGEPAAGDRPEDLAAHVEAWGDWTGRTTESAVSMLEHAADDYEALRAQIAHTPKATAGQWAELRHTYLEPDPDSSCDVHGDLRAVA